MDTIVGQRFEGARLVVSGVRLERCVLVDCELVFDGRSTQLIDNTLERCRWLLEGAAAATINLLATLCRDDTALADAIARELGLPVPTGLLH